MKPKFAPSILLLLLLSLPWLACGTQTHNPKIELDYLVQIEPGEPITVHLTVTGGAARRPALQILNGAGVIQNQAGKIKSLAATDPGYALERESRQDRTIWRYAKRAPKTYSITYRVESYDPYLSPEATFVSDRRAVALGYSTFLVPLELSDYLPCTIRVRIDTPESWPVWTSWQGDGSQFTPQSVHELWSGGIVAGKFKESRLESAHCGVTVLTEHRGAARGLNVANRLLPVIRESVELFGAAPNSKFLEVMALYRTMPMTDRKSRMMGVSENNSFFCLATADRYQDLEQITLLAAHECLHFYLGGAIVPKPKPPFNNSPELIWLIEGVTEYLAHELMVEASVMKPARFNEIVESKRKQVKEHEYASVSLAIAAGKFNRAETYQVVYSKGFLIAQALDQYMAEQSGEGAFDAALKDLFQTHNFNETHEWVTASEVKAIFEAHCPGAAAWIETYAEGSVAHPNVSDASQSE